VQQQTQRRFVTGQQLDFFHGGRKLFCQVGQLGSTTSQALSELAGILKNVREQADAVPHANHCGPTSRQQSITRRSKSRLRPLWFEACPLAAQPGFQFLRQGVVRGEQVFDLIR